MKLKRTTVDVEGAIEAVVRQIRDERSEWRKDPGVMLARLWSGVGAFIEDCDRKGNKRVARRLRELLETARDG